MIDKEPLLDLSTDKSVGFVNIEDSGKTLPYNLIKIGFLSVLQRDRLTALSRTLSSASLKTAKDEEKYDGVLLDMLRIVIPSASRGLLSKLPLMEKIDTINAYMGKLGLVKKKVTRLTRGPKARKKRRGQI